MYTGVHNKSVIMAVRNNRTEMGWTRGMYVYRLQVSIEVLYIYISIVGGSR